MGRSLANVCSVSLLSCAPLWEWHLRDGTLSAALGRPPLRVCSVGHACGYTRGSWCLLCSMHLRYPVRGGTWVVAVASLSSQPSEYKVTRDRRVRGTHPEPSQEQPRLAWLWPDPACPPVPPVLEGKGLFCRNAVPVHPPPSPALSPSLHQHRGQSSPLLTAHLVLRQEGVWFTAREAWHSEQVPTRSTGLTDGGSVSATSVPGSVLMGCPWHVGCVSSWSRRGQRL